MNDRKTTRAVFPGTFDPITNGHVDVIRRGAALLGELIVAVGENPAKTPLLPHGRRVEVAREVVAGLGLANVRVEAYTGLTVEFARRMDAPLLLRGIRGGSDVRAEAEMAHTNRKMTGVETIFLLASPEVAFISSSLTRQIATEGGDISGLVPREVLRCLAGSRPKD